MKYCKIITISTLFTFLFWTNIFPNEINIQVMKEPLSFLTHSFIAAKRKKPSKSFPEKEYTIKTAEKKKIIKIIRTHAENNKAIIVPPKYANNRYIMSEAIKISPSYFDQASERLKNDRDFVIEAIKNSPNYLNNILVLSPEKFKKDREIIKSIVRTNGSLLQSASKKLRNDREIVKLAIKSDPNAFQFASRKLRGEKELYLLSLAKGGFALSHATQKIKKNKELVKNAIKSIGAHGFNDASSKLKKDKKLVFELIDIAGGEILNYASKSVKNDKQIVLKAIKAGGYYFHLLPDKMKNDIDIIKSALKEDPSSVMENLSDSLRKNRELNLLALKHGCSLTLIDDTLKNDQDFILEAIKNNSNILEKAYNLHKDNHEIILRAITQSNSISLHKEVLKNSKNKKNLLLEIANTKPKLFFRWLQSMSELTSTVLDLCLTDKDILLASLKIEPSLLKYKEYIPANLLNDKEFITKLTVNNGLVLEYLPLRYQDDPEIAQTAVDQNIIAYQWVSPGLKSSDIIKLDAEKFVLTLLPKEKFASLTALKKSNEGEKEDNNLKNLRKNKNFIKKMIGIEGSVALAFAHPEQLEDKEILLSAIKQTGHAIWFIPKKFKDDKELLFEIVKHDGIAALNFASSKFRDNKELVLSAIENNKNALEFASKRLRKDKDILSKINQEDK